jgi:hypothetical protein
MQNVGVQGHVIQNLDYVKVLALLRHKQIGLTAHQTPAYDRDPVSVCRFFALYWLSAISSSESSPCIPLPNRALSSSHSCPVPALHSARNLRIEDDSLDRGQAATDRRELFACPDTRRPLQRTAAARTNLRFPLYAL